MGSVPGWRTEVPHAVAKPVSHNSRNLRARTETQRSQKGKKMKTEGIHDPQTRETCVLERRPSAAKKEREKMTTEGIHDPQTSHPMALRYKETCKQYNSPGDVWQRVSIGTPPLESASLWPGSKTQSFKLANLLEMK